MKQSILTVAICDSKTLLAYDASMTYTCQRGSNRPLRVAIIGAGNLGFPETLQRQAQDVLSVYEDRWNLAHQ